MTHDARTDDSPATSPRRAYRHVGAWGGSSLGFVASLPADIRRELDGIDAAQSWLGGALAGLTEDQARQPSRLPGWSVGHVLTHIARNADGLRRMLEGALRGEQAMQYPGGMAQRNDEIDAGASRPASELRDDVRITSSAFTAAAAELSANQWAEGSGLPRSASSA